MNAVITRLDIGTHKRYLLKILLEISRDKILAKSLVFKGGTALLLFYGLDRFSTDLDFDLVKSENSEEKILKRLGAILKKHGKLKDLQLKRYTIFGLLSYGELDYNIKIEINRRGLSGEYSLKNLLGIEMNVMNLEDMCTNKFVALLGRNKTANRDIYDIWYMFENNFEINKKLLEEKTQLSFEEYIQKVILFLVNLGDNYNILDGLGVVLDSKQKSFVKNRLIGELLFFLRGYLV